MSEDDWVPVKVTILDYNSVYSKDERVRLVPGTKEGEWVTVLVQRKYKDDIKTVHSNLSCFF